jgi:hypothetical protein
MSVVLVILLRWLQRKASYHVSNGRQNKNGKNSKYK